MGREPGPENIGQSSDFGLVAQRYARTMGLNQFNGMGIYGSIFIRVRKSSATFLLFNALI